MPVMPVDACSAGLSSFFLSSLFHVIQSDELLVDKPVILYLALLLYALISSELVQRVMINISNKHWVDVFITLDQDKVMNKVPIGEINWVGVIKFFDKRR